MNPDDIGFSYQVAHAATAPTSVTTLSAAKAATHGQLGTAVTQRAEPTVQSRTPVESPITNFQLAFWRDAKQKYQAIDPAEPTLPEQYVLVLASLGFSITFLFGVNFPVKDDREETPNLVMIANNWGLKKSNTGNPDLFRRFKELADYFTDNLRHTNSKRIESPLLRLDFATVRGWMRTTQEVWNWFFKWYYTKYGDGTVPSEQCTEFQETF
jgi:hypothetical protein